MHRTAIIVAFPELAGIVDKWRKETVEVASKGVPPHITLLFPWVDAPVGQHDLKVVSDVCEQTPSFVIEFEKIKMFESGTVYCSVKNDEKMMRLAHVIWNQFPETPPYGGIHAQPITHLTVAQGDALTANELYNEVLVGFGDKLPISATVREVVVIEEDGQEQWKIRATFALV